MAKNLTRAEKKAHRYKEALQHGQGKNLDPRSFHEIKADKSLDPISKQSDEEGRLSGSQNQQYTNDGLISPTQHDDYGDESMP